MSDKLGILLLGLGGGGEAAPLKSHLPLLALKSGRGDETLNLRGLGVGGLAVFAGDGALDNEGNDGLRLVQTVNLTDVVGTLGSTEGRLVTGRVGETGNVLGTLLDDNKSQNRKVSSDNASANGLAALVTITAVVIVRARAIKEKANTAVLLDTLHHGETLLVVTTEDEKRCDPRSDEEGKRKAERIENGREEIPRNLKNIASPFLSKRVSRNEVGDTLVIEEANLALIVDFEKLLGSEARVGDIKLHVRFRHK